MQIRLECTYCGHKWNVVAYHNASIKTMDCPKCKDSHLKAKEIGASDILDAYVGCPPFPSENLEIDEYDLTPSGDY